MKINIGDRVRFLNEVGEGVVTKISGKDLVDVLIEDGFELPTHVNELVVVAQASAQNNKKPEIQQKPIVNNEKQTKQEPVKVVQEPIEEIEEIEGNDAPNVYFAYVPEKPEDILTSKIKLFMINDCNYFLMYSIAIVTENNTKYFKHGIINPNSKILQNTLHFDEINKIEQFVFNLIFYKKSYFTQVKPIDYTLKVSPRKFTKPGCFDENDFFDENALLHCISSNIEKSVNQLQEKDLKSIALEKHINEELQKNPNIKYLPKAEPLTMEVYLHINHLLADCRGMSNKEILDFQMKEFHTKFNEAVNTHFDRVVFIHGIGNGTLKSEVRRLLSETYSRFKFQDASFKEYGYGATMVILK